MPFWIANRAAPALWKRVPWKMVWAVSVWLVQKGRERLDENLTKKERRNSSTSSPSPRAAPATSRQRDQTRLKNIAGKAIRG